MSLFPSRRVGNHKTILLGNHKTILLGNLPTSLNMSSYKEMFWYFRKGMDSTVLYRTQVPLQLSSIFQGNVLAAEKIFNYNRSTLHSANTRTATEFNKMFSVRQPHQGEKNSLFQGPIPSPSSVCCWRLDNTKTDNHMSYCVLCISPFSLGPVRNVTPLVSSRSQKVTPKTNGDIQNT